MCQSGRRMACCVYRRLNKVTEADRFLMGNIPETIFGYSGVYYFTRMNLVKVYYQMKLKEKRKEYTEFCIVSFQYRFKGLSFGRKNVPTAF